MMSKYGLAVELAIRDLGVTAASVMNGCEKYGMTHGCDVDCPVLNAGECELKDDVNKELWAEVREYKFENVSCSSCGEDFGPGDNGFSHCESHSGITPID